MNKFNFKALLPFVVLACAPLASHASVSVGISISVAPPELPVGIRLGLFASAAMTDDCATL